MRVSTFLFSVVLIVAVVAAFLVGRSNGPPSPGAAAANLAIMGSPPTVPRQQTQRDPELVMAIRAVEGGGVGKAGEVGPLQIRAVMIEDVNRIVGEQRYTLNDAASIDKSTEIFWIFADHYSPGASREVIARRWNGGPNGDTKPSTATYWHRVCTALDG